MSSKEMREAIVNKTSSFEGEYSYLSKVVKNQPAKPIKDRKTVF